MSQDENRHDPSRRTFLATAAVVTSAAVIGLRPRRAEAAALPLLSQSNNPLAKSMGYEPNAGQVDKGKYRTYAPGEHCAVCQFFQGAAGEKTGYAGCQLYPGYRVAAQGWCASFTARS